MSLTPDLEISTQATPASHWTQRNRRRGSDFFLTRKFGVHFHRRKGYLASVTWCSLTPSCRTKITPCRGLRRFDEGGKHVPKGARTSLDAGSYTDRPSFSRTCATRCKRTRTLPDAQLSSKGRMLTFETRTLPLVATSSPSQRPSSRSSGARLPGSSRTGITARLIAILSAHGHEKNFMISRAHSLPPYYRILMSGATAPSIGSRPSSRSPSPRARSTGSAST